MVRARRERQPRERALEQRLALSVRLADALDLPRLELRVGLALPRALAGSRLRDPRTHGCARLGAVPRAPRERLRGQRGDLDLQVDAVEQRPGDATPVARDLVGRAAASAARVSEIAARAWIHRRDKLKARREARLARCARDVDAAGLERLAQNLEDTAVPFGQL